MKKIFSKAWKASARPAKQRKYVFRAPLHVQGHFMHSMLSKELRRKHGIRTVRVRKGDKVLIMRGQFKGQDGKVENVDVKGHRIFVSKMEVQKKDGSRARLPIHPSNVQIIELDLADKKRMEPKKQAGLVSSAKEADRKEGD